MFRRLALIEEDGFFWINPCGNEARTKLAGVFRKVTWVLPNGNRVHVHHAIDGLKSARLLHIYKTLHRA